MPHVDLHGLPLTCASAEAASAFNDHRARLSQVSRRHGRAHERARWLPIPGFALAHMLKGYFAMLSFKQANVPMAQDALSTANGLLATASRREQAHAAALSHWIAGDLDRTLATWEEILDAHPTDVLAFRLHHFNAFWLGRPEVMAREVEAAMPRWAPELRRLGRAARLPLLRARGARQLRRRRACRPRGHRHRPGRPVGRARRRPCAGDAGPARRGHPVAGRPRAPLGGRQQPQASPVVASRALSFRAARVRRGARRSTTAASAISPRR